MARYRKQRRETVWIGARLLMNTAGSAISEGMQDITGQEVPLVGDGSNRFLEAVRECTILAAYVNVNFTMFPASTDNSNKVTAWGRSPFISLSVTTAPSQSWDSSPKKAFLVCPITVTAPASGGVYVAGVAESRSKRIVHTGDHIVWSMNNLQKAELPSYNPTAGIGYARLLVTV